MTIGIDLDNTIINYKNAYKKYIKNTYKLNTRHLSSKQDFKRYIIDNFGEIAWTKAQGEIYTTYINYATIYPGFLNFLNKCNKLGIKISIISHKTKYPALGPRINMINKALYILNKFKITKRSNIKIKFVETKEDKINEIIKEDLPIFIDDLEEIFTNSKLSNDLIMILFDKEISKNNKYFILDSWKKIYNLLFKLINNIDEFRLKILKLKFNNRLKILKNITSLNSTNYVAKLDGKKIFLKIYKNYPGDTRDRQENEYNASSYIYKYGNGNWNAKPLFLLKNINVSIFEYSPGVGKRGMEISNKYLFDALEFIKVINLNKNNDKYNFHNASEACFSISEYINSVEIRLKKLILICNIDKNIKFGLKNLLINDILPFWNNIKIYILSEIKIKNIDIDNKLTTDEIILSPSDFGFHNSLIYKGKIKFIDFEYFGYDDPIKLICDFLLHPAMSLNKSQKLIFKTRVFKDYNYIQIEDKFELIYLILSVKWICIILNQFLIKNTNVDILIDKIKLARLQLTQSMIEFENIKQLSI